MSLILARVGSTHLAASEIVIHIVSVSFLPGWGLSEAGGILVGRYLGAGQRRYAARAIGSARVIALCFMGICGLLFALRGHWLASLFTLDPEVARIAGILLLFAAVFQIFDALAMVHIGAMQGAGDTRFALIVCTATGWGITVPTALILGLWMGWGAPGAYLGLTIEIIILAFITGWRVRGIASGKVGRMDLLLGEECHTT
jgi:MATE family multidrug resistance protein